LPVAQQIWRYPVNIRQVTIERANTYTIDNQEIDATVTIFYRLPPDRLEFIYRNVPDYEAAGGGHHHRFASSPSSAR
jgi:hypothetical protein